MLFVLDVLNEELNDDCYEEAKEHPEQQAGSFYLSSPVEIEEPSVACRLALFDNVTKDRTLACPLDVQRTYQGDGGVLLATSSLGLGTTHDY